MAHYDNCGGEIIFEKTQNSVHYAKWVCGSCDKWFAWIKNPEKEGQRTRTSQYDIRRVMQFHRYHKEPFCFFCSRILEQLGCNETLTIDHIEEINDGGQDVLPNLQILCSACHKLKNWNRLYHNKHINGIKNAT